MQNFESRMEAPDAPPNGSPSPRASRLRQRLPTRGDKRFRFFGISNADL
jgi:hypothetical protein